VDSFDDLVCCVKDFFRTPHLGDLEFLDEPGLISPGYVEDLLSTYRSGLHKSLSIGTLAAYHLAQHRIEELKREQGCCGQLWETFKDGISSIPSHLMYPLLKLNAKVGALSGILHSAHALGNDTFVFWRYNGRPQVDTVLTEVCTTQNLLR